MSTKNPTQMPKRESQVPEPQIPKCPHCQAELLAIEKFNWADGSGWVVLCVLCPHCRVALHFGIVPPRPAAGEPEPPGPQIHIPS